MTSTELRVALAALHWSQRGLATILAGAGGDVGEGLARRWARGSVAVPDVVGVWLGLLAGHALAHPPPMVARLPGVG